MRWVQRAVSRGDPDGLDVRWDIDAAAPVTRVEVDLLDDGEAPLAYVSADWRVTKGLRIKPVREGVYVLQVQAWTAGGACGAGVGPVPVTVVR